MHAAYRTQIQGELKKKKTRGTLHFTLASTKERGSIALDSLFALGGFSSNGKGLATSIDLHFIQHYGARTTGNNYNSSGLQR